MVLFHAKMLLDPLVGRNGLDLLFSAETSGRFKDTHVSVEVVSMVKIGQAQQESIGSFLREVSPTTAEALADHRWNPELFEWEPYVKRD